MNDTFTIENDAFERTVNYTNEDSDVFVNIELTGKEGIDVIQALDELNEAVANGRFDTDLPVQEMRNMTRGGLHFPNDCTVLIPSQQHARVLMHALVKYELEDTDFTERVRTDVLAALEKSPMDFDVNALRQIQ